MKEVYTMREFARTETMLEKCHYCGCKNKLYTDIIDKKKRILGHTLRCCNCGRTVIFIYPQFTQLTIIDFINHKLISGSQKCIQESFCPHKNCKLYGSCQMPIPDNNQINNNVCKCDTYCNFQYQNELTINELNKPKFL